MAPARKSTAKRTTTKKRTTAKKETASGTRRYTDAQIEDAIDALAAGNIHNAQRALSFPNEEPEGDEE